MIDFLSSKTKTFLIFGLLAFVTLSIFGLGYMSDMEANKDYNMEGCIFTGKTMLCKMGVVEHISLWQDIFTAMPRESLMLLALLVLLTAVIFITKSIPAPPRLSKNTSSTQRLYLVQHPNLSFFNPINGAFSQGILNPKIYKLALL